MLEQMETSKIIFNKVARRKWKKNLVEVQKADEWMNRNTRITEKTGGVKG